MKKNLGTADRIIRLIIAAIFAYLYFGSVITGTTGLVLMILGVVFTLTSIFSFCPLYTIFGISTCQTEKQP